MPESDVSGNTGAPADLYPAGHLEGLSLDALTAERDRQRAADTTSATARAVLCTTEILRRRLTEFAPKEPSA